MSSVKIFCGEASEPLAAKIAHHYGKPLGAVTRRRFSDGEISTAFNESIRGYDVFIIQSTMPPADNLMEMLIMIDGAKRASAANVTVVIPYFGYARQDRKDRPRVSIAAKLNANLISAAGADRIVFCDLHAGQIQGFFDIPVDHLHASAIFVPYLKSLKLKNPIFASPDVGGVARARKYSEYLGCDFVVCHKYRKEANEIAEMHVIGDVTGKDVVLIDDMVDTAGTICKSADLLKEKGAKSVRAACTHGVLSGKALENIEASALEEIVITDTIPQHKTGKKVKVLSVAELFSKAIRKIHDHESVSSLFI